MNAQVVRFDEILENYDDALRAAGYAHAGRAKILNRATMLVQWHDKAGCLELNDEVVAEYFHDIDQRLCEGKLNAKSHRNLFREVDKFLNFCKTGSVIQPCPLKGSRLRLTPEYQRIADAFLASGDFHPNTKNDMRWVVHKYFAWLDEHGHGDLTGLGVAPLQGFLLDCSKQLSPSSMHNIKLYMKKLYAYLYAEKLSESSYEALLSFRVNRESKMYPVLPMSDVDILLNAIDRRTKSGKRAYAAMTLGAELSLRACDVVNLKRSDIDWVKGEIKVLQSKTVKPLVLPLTEKVGEALSDYILNARPMSEERHIFLRLRQPYTPLRSAVTIGEIYRDCCIVAGLPVSKSFHTLRRSLTTAMVSNGVKATDAAQVLGGDLNSIKKYVALDSKHLKRCALSFDGIAPDGWTQGGGAQ